MLSFQMTLYRFIMIIISSKSLRITCMDTEQRQSSLTHSNGRVFVVGVVRAAPSALLRLPAGTHGQRELLRALTSPQQRELLLNTENTAQHTTS